ncbi:glycosyltransferase family 2 protein [Sinorhizobium fredii]|uniref:glycosyltransferase family 2 protein n=1 Tax=Rhizobium fredii TaxID=380 RepID=UPI0004B2EDAE|nr:glycosyltransferase [Sinorhizobium fredii]MCG5473296.1 glycosyltransferase family 2 protein [Sinorhizobium fredii]
MPLNVLSVVVCTHNRAEDALECLRALHEQIDYANSEVILVDSASSPAQQQLLQHGISNLQKPLYLRLEQPGLSLARNEGLARCKGEWVAFVDDDAVPNPDWYEELLSVLRNAPDDWGAIGGRIVPVFPAGGPPDLGPRWKRYLSINDTVGSRDCTAKFELIAANSCFRRAALDAVGGFPTELGRSKKSLLSGEDVLVMWRIRRLGWKIWYDGSFCVGHKIPADRLTKRWVRARAYWEGISTIRMARLLSDRGRFRLILKAAIAAPVLGILSLLMPKGYEWDLRLRYDLGVVIESLRFRPKSSSA